VSLRRLVLPLFTAVLCLGQATWQTVTDPPGVDWKGLSAAKKQTALRIMQSEGCSCGCGMKLAECRVKDPSCGFSRKLTGAVVKETLAGKDAAAIRAELKRISEEPPPVLDDAVTISTAGDPVLGPANARMTIVEFSDFQCPYCSKAVSEVKEVMRQMPKDVKIIFKQFPLESHSDAEFGAEASLAAQAQGKFWEMHDMIFAAFPKPLTRTLIFSFAKQMNLNIPKFTADLDSHKFKARVMAEEQEGEVAGVAGTPTFFLNGKKYNSTFEAAQVLPLIRKELAN
jgi:protein-disulfide isomerase